MRLQFPAESGQLLLRNDTQRRSGEAAAVDPDSTLAPQHTAAQSQGHSQGLVLRRAGGGDILEVFPGGCTGSIDQRQKARDVAGFQGTDLGQDPAVFVKHMNSPQDSPVPGQAAHSGRRR